jgi:scyllo-inositol 2-dehydrogenase (NADP+)
MNRTEASGKLILMQSIDVGIVGFGRIGAEHAGWISACGFAKPTTVFDVTPARAELAKSRGLQLTGSLDELLKSSVDAILITTPTSMHFDHASAALNAGKHVMVDKPVTLNLTQARELAKLANAKQRILSVFQNRRWDIDFLSMQKAIRDGVVGKVFNVESRLGQWSSCVGPAAREFRPNWRNEASFGGGGLFDWGSHFVDQIWRLMIPAKPQTVFAQLRGNVWTKDCDDFARVCINFDNGAVAMVEINTTTTRPLPRWHVDGTTRELPPAEPGLNESQIWQHFARACRGQDAPAVTIQSVLPTMALLDAARESSRTNSAVAIDSSLFEEN